MAFPTIIQGGMGVAISHWGLARTVSQLGQLGVVSGTGVSRVLVSRLMDGDVGGHMRRALSAFPFQDTAQEILKRYFVAGGKASDQPYKATPVPTLHPPKFLDALTVAANFVEVFLAKEGHGGLVGMNLLEKVQLPTMASLYGAMLAGVDYVLMGAGIPTQIAGILDRLAKHLAVKYRVDVVGASQDDSYTLGFDPQDIFSDQVPTLPLRRPQFLPIIASVVLAQALIKRSEGSIDGFIVEGPTAGGHNAPPRGAPRFNERGEPVYGEKDVVDLDKIKLLGRPFWLAGEYGHPERLKQALEAGAAGVQVGTAFALCNESGLDVEFKQALIRKAVLGEADVLTSAVISPTGFPFKVARLEGTLSEAEEYEKRPRICDFGFLRTIYKKADGTLGYRCPAEPVDDYVAKGGKAEDTVGRSCLCNNLIATAGFPQVRKNGYVELPVITTGDDLVNVGRLLAPGQTSYSAANVIAYLLGE
ncbi:MAG: nitronate monooxygenase [Thermoflexales bacterium]|nr:nitronate monooxygenase [Thermoflexales bacterium]